jgi:hypothetical protein
MCRKIETFAETKKRFNPTFRETFVGPQTMIKDEYEKLSLITCIKILETHTIYLTVFLSVFFES